jgi:hypothetical protein
LADEPNDFAAMDLQSSLSQYRRLAPVAHGKVCRQEQILL